MENVTLASILREMGIVLDSLGELATQKGHAVAAGNTTLLDEIVLREEQLTRELARLEWERGNMAASSSAPPLERSLKESLAEKIGHLKRLNEHNQDLLRKMLAVVRFDMDLFFPKLSYKRDARPLAPLFFDRRT